jgi:hypothetical protein
MICYFMVSFLIFVLDLESMDHKEAQEIHRALCRHEDLIQCNRSSLFLVTSKVHKNEHLCTSQNATIMGVLVNKSKK